jgi:hypothetical protein
MCEEISPGDWNDLLRVLKAQQQRPWLTQSLTALGFRLKPSPLVAMKQRLAQLTALKAPHKPNCWSWLTSSISLIQESVQYRDMFHGWLNLHIPPHIIPKLKSTCSLIRKCEICLKWNMTNNIAVQRVPNKYNGSSLAWLFVANSDTDNMHGGNAGWGSRPEKR